MQESALYTAEVRERVQRLHRLYEDHKIRSSLFVAGYVIALCKARHPRNWISGRTSPPATADLTAYALHYPHFEPGTNWSGDQADPLDLLGLDQQDCARVQKFSRGSVSILSILSHCSLLQVPKQTQQLLIDWVASKEFPIVVMSKLPSAATMQRYQCQGKRIVTVLTSPEAMGKVYKDAYPPYESQDCLDFCLHDLRHAAKFLAADLYEEQVGFNICMSVSESLAPFTDYLQDRFFRADMDHVRSDMNTAAIHSLCFVKARYISACHRSIYPPPCSKTRFDDEEHAWFHQSRWIPLLTAWGMTSELIPITLPICQGGTLSTDDKNALRSWFQHKGRERLLMRPCSH